MPFKVPSLTLNNGTKIPTVGLGCWMGAVGRGQRVFDMCTKALKAGYRHFDTAAGYGNEAQVGAAIRASGIPRSEIYITTKLGVNHTNVKESFEASLKELDCGYIDLYLIHWPQITRPDDSSKAYRPDEHPNFIDAWKEMEKFVETGKVKTIGVSNFSVKTLKKLIPHCSIIPATNQVESHPCLPQNDLKTFCEEKGILLTAYSPLGRSATFFSEPTITRIADKLKTSPAQVVLSWGVQRGTIVIPKSEDEGRMSANITLIELPTEDMEAINKIHNQPGMHKSLLTFHKPGGVVFGWTYEELGWNMKEGGIVPSG
ncbi:Aldo/keto reductase [Collybia nuda]|uniref:Aldo/keto reductase n=1 Tax=Collybia nuda TaxID=64659 RepID=A0A9P6CJF8_9AGAR|nr:Aldo/keto reductase [Collybia nuda]